MISRRKCIDFMGLGLSGCASVTVMSSSMADGRDPAFDCPSVPAQIELVGNVVSVTVGSAQERRAVEEIKNAYTWARGESLLISETGVPTIGDNVGCYANIMHTVLAVTDMLNIGIVGWSESDWWPDTHRVSLNPDGPVRNLFVQYARGNHHDVIGTALAGGEFSMEPDKTDMEQIGSHGGKYIYHLGSDRWRRIAKDFSLVRFPFRFERLFDSDGSFNEADLSLFVSALDEARSVGLHLLLDPHNYGGLLANGVQNVLGSSVFTEDLYLTMMQNLGVLAARHSDVVTMIGLMNEPKHVKPSRRWERIAQRGVDALRDGGFAGVIEVPTANWQGIQDAPGLHPNGPWIRNPRGPITYGVHQYFNDNYDGFNYAYDSDEAAIMRKGFKPGTVEIPLF